MKEKGASKWYLFDRKTKKLIAGPVNTRQLLLASAAAKKLKITADSLSASETKTTDKKTKKSYVAFGVPKNTVVVSCGTDAVVCPGTGTPASTTWYLFKTDNPDDRTTRTRSPS